MPTLRLTSLIAGLCLVALLPTSAACAAEDDAEASQTRIANINGEDFSVEMFRLFFSERLRAEEAENNPEFQEKAFNEFVNLVVLAQEGKRRELDERSDVRSALALQELKLLSGVAQQAILSDDPPSDAELKEAYDEFIAQAERTEYKARHILLDNEEKAEEIIAQLDQGADFTELAKEHSLGPTGKNGGELDWFNSNQMVKPFADAVAALEPNNYTKQPVRTQFGWHVIRLEETRKAEPPSFEEAKPQLTIALQRQKLAESVMELRREATVTLNTDVVKLKEQEDAE